MDGALEGHAGAEEAVVVVEEESGFNCDRERAGVETEGENICAGREDRFFFFREKSTFFTIPRSRKV